MVFGEIESAISLYERIKQLFKKSNATTEESLSSCFVHLFETHGVTRNQIPRFFGFGLTVADVGNDDVLLTKLIEEIS